MRSEEASAHPERIGKYRILSTLGRGAMGRVYLGEDPHIGRKVAVKVLAGATGDEARSRFLEEARTIGHLSHPEIVTLLEFGFHEGQPFLVMEHLEGESFDHWLAQAPSDRRILEVLLALCRAVAYAHGQGVLHRDIKPSNLQVLADGRTKLLDFGIARSGSVALTATGMLMGTPQYLAPEVLEGKGHSRASDVYAVGLVAYEALAGTSPFAADTLEQCLKRVLIETPKPLEEIRPDLPVELSRAVMASMAKDPGDRPTGVEPLLAALEHALESAAPGGLDRPTVRISPEAVGQVEESPRTGGGRRALWLVAGATALAAVTVAGWLALSPGRSAERTPEPIADSSPEQPLAEEIGGDLPPAAADRVDSTWPTGADDTTGADAGEIAADQSGLAGEAELETGSNLAERPGPRAGATTPAQPAEHGETTPRERGTTVSPPDGSSEDRLASHAERSPPTNPSETARPKDLAAPRDGAPTETEAEAETTGPDPASTPSNQRTAGPIQADGEPAAADLSNRPKPPTEGARSEDDQRPADRRQETEAATPAQPPEQDLLPAPTLAHLSPSVIRRGALVTLELEGSGFSDATRVEVRRGSVPIPALEVRRIRLRAAGRLRVTLYVAHDAPLGLYSLVAVDPDGGPSNSLGLEVSL